MRYREDIELLEFEVLDERAAKAAQSRGRATEEEQCAFRTDFQRDRDRIVHSKSFRRLMHKTQVFISPEGDHYRTRLTHTIEVAQVARTVARILGYNEDLTEAIALGHDLGHTPFGHSGEYALDSVHPGGFKHNEQSLRVVEKLEITPERIGLNLTAEVKDGILNHRGSGAPFTLEGQIVKICDRIAYINHDIDDALRSGILSEKDLPRDEIDLLGKTHSVRINNMITDLASNSEGKDRVALSDDYNDALNSLRRFMFENVYLNGEVKNADAETGVEEIVKGLYHYFNEHPEEIPDFYKGIEAEDGTAVAVKDYVSGMTDRYAYSKYDELFGHSR